MSIKNKIPKIKIESQNDTKNFLYLSFIEYQTSTYLCVIDNLLDDTVSAYVLDLADQENISVSSLLNIATRWFYGFSDVHPFSIMIAKAGMTEQLAPIYRSFNLAFVKRIIGQTFSYPNLTETTVKRRRMFLPQEGTEIKLIKLSTSTT